MKIKDLEPVKPDNSDDPRRELFLKLLLENQMRIHAYILALVPNYADADDILQQTSSLMWRKFDDFKPGTNFTSWGIRIAHYEIMGYRKRRNRDKLVFGDDFLEDMIPIVEQENKNTDGKIEALRQCVKKLGMRGRELVKLRYYEGMKAKEMSSRTGLTVAVIYKSLARINGHLLSCIERTIRRIG